MQSIKGKHFLTGEELSRAELNWLLESALELKKNRAQKNTLGGKTIALIFEKPSLRTRVSFTVGVTELGGVPLDFTSQQTKAEEPEDAIRVLQGMVHGLMLRTFDHEKLERMKKHATIPIINGLSDSHHPCQTLADILTLKEKFGTLKGLTVAYIGDGNNILNSLLLIAPQVGINVHYSCPKEYRPDAEIVQRAQVRTEGTGAVVKAFASPEEAVVGAHAIYTDVWTSMGFEAENKIRLEAFAGYQVNMELVKKARPDAIVLHCLPMVCEQEITREVVESSQSALFQQAENRLHAQKALMMGIFYAQ